ncbi:SAR1012 family small protein [Staphylococcus warneri]
MMNIIKRVVRTIIIGYIVKIIRDLISGKSNGKK